MESVNYAPEDARFVLDNNEGWISLIRRSGEEIDIVNAARVSFGKLKTKFEGDILWELIHFLSFIVDVFKR